MSNLFKQIQNEYDLSKASNYIKPRIYNANGDLSKRWYVYYSYLDPETGKIKRQSPI